jgi:hypothetical protein
MAQQPNMSGVELLPRQGPGVGETQQVWDRKVKANQIRNALVKIAPRETTTRAPIHWRVVGASLGLSGSAPFTNTPSM